MSLYEIFEKYMQNIFSSIFQYINIYVGCNGENMYIVISFIRDKPIP